MTAKVAGSGTRCWPRGCPGGSPPRRTRTRSGQDTFTPAPRTTPPPQPRRPVDTGADHHHHLRRLLARLLQRDARGRVVQRYVDVMRGCSPAGRGGARPTGRRPRRAGAHHPRGRRPARGHPGGRTWSAAAARSPSRCASTCRPARTPRAGAEAGHRPYQRSGHRRRRDRDTLAAPGTTVVETFDVRGARGRQVRGAAHVPQRAAVVLPAAARAATANSLDAAGNRCRTSPVPRTPSRDLWFYANPVFVDVLP